MKELLRKILYGKRSLFCLELPFRVRLFNVLALLGGLISLINGTFSYINNQDFMILGVNLIIAILSFVLLFYAYKSKKYQFCYIVTIVIIFLLMFPYLFFKSGGYKGGMISFYMFGILFTVFMLEGRGMLFTVMTEMFVYIATILIAYKYPDTVIWFLSEKEVVTDLLIGFIASSISIGVAMYLHFRMYNKQQKILEDARVEAQSANKAKSAFLANMSHEIRTPINVMLGMNEMILRESESEEIKQYAKSIERSGGYLISLINNVLDISRIESGKMEIEEGKYELVQLLEEVMLIGEKQAEQKGLKMQLFFAEDLPEYLIGDMIHIKQVLLNIINNAVKYTNEGQITIKVSKKEEKQLLFEIADTGIGIKEADLEVLFDVFMRVDHEKNQRIEGTGLGLSIAKQLVEQMGGRIFVESVYGKGSRFFIELPIKVASDGKIKNKENNKTQRKYFVAPKAKILVVDDNKENLMVVKSLLKRTAIFVDVELSGAECIKKVRENSYDIIFLDYMMPQMDGIDTIRELKKNPEFKIPVIALSADVTKGIEQTFLKEGFCSYLSKPIIWNQLEDILIEYLRKDLIFMRQEEVKKIKIPEEVIHKIKNYLKDNDILIEEGLKLLDGDFLQYRKLMEFFVEYQKNHMKEDMPVDEMTRMMHTLKSNAKAIGAMNLHELAKELEFRAKKEDLEYIRNGYPLLKFEWNRVLNTVKKFLEMTQDIVENNSKEEVCNGSKEQLKVLIMRYQAKEAKEQIKRLLEGQVTDEERKLLEKMEIATDELDFDEAEILFKRWEAME